MYRLLMLSSSHPQTIGACCVTQCRSSIPFLRRMGAPGHSILTTSLAELAHSPPQEWVCYVLEEMHRQKGSVTAAQVGIGTGGAEGQVWVGVGEAGPVQCL